MKKEYFLYKEFSKKDYGCKQNSTEEKDKAEKKRRNVEDCSEIDKNEI